MRFLLVGLSAVLVVSSLPLPVVAEELLVSEESTVATTVAATTDTPEQKETIETNESLAPATTFAESLPDSLVAESTDNSRQPPTPDSVIITEIQTAGTDEFVELYNPNDDPLPLTGLSLWYRGSGASVVQLVDLNNIVLQSKSFTVFGHVASMGGMAVGFAKASYSLNDTIGEVLIGKTAAVGDVLDKVAWGGASFESGYIYDVSPATAPPKNSSLQRCFVNTYVAFAEPKDTSKEFTIYSNDLPTPQMGMSCIVPEPPKPVNNCEGLRINEVAANTDDQFIEIRNDTDHDVALTDCQLQTNRSTTKTYVFSEEILPPGSLRTVRIKDTSLTLTKTTSGVVYILSSDGLSETDMQAYSNLATDTSWSRSETGEWMQTYMVTPDALNIIQKYLPCDDGYERNIDTGRCNKILVLAAAADCDDGKYRSEETGRCRSIPAASILTACKLGQYRSEDTNRCRNIVTASIQKPCKDNQYRSEETNRCRNLPVTTVPDAAFAVQPVKDTASAFIGWWALGGVSLLAVGYGVWEWREEIRQVIGRIASRFSAGR